MGAGAAAAAQGEVPARLLRRFGSEAAAVAAAGPIEPLAGGLPQLQCEVRWAVDVEGATTPADIERRLRLDLVPHWRAAARPYVDEVCSTAQ